MLVGCDSTEISIGRIYFSVWGAKQLLETCLSECSKRHLQISNFFVCDEWFPVICLGVGWFFLLEFCLLVYSSEQRRPEKVFAQNSLQL